MRAGEVRDRLRDARAAIDFARRHLPARDEVDQLIVRQAVHRARAHLNRIAAALKAQS